MTLRKANGLGLLSAILFFSGAVSPETIIRQSSAATHPPLTTDQGVVASDHPVASKVGAAVLGKGGNAVDAAVATALTLGVVSPVSSGIGGGGFAVVYIAAEKRLYAFDFRETGPAAIGPHLFRRDGKFDSSLSRLGGLAVAIPGEVAGLDLLSSRFGALPWADVVRPAEQIAERGFSVTWFLANATKAVLPRMDKSWLLTKALTRGGKPVTAGMTVRRKALAKTLRMIRQRRSAGFYQGPVAQDIVSTVQRYGGVLTAADLASYKVEERDPLIGTFGGLRVATMPLPSSGGIALLQTLGMLEMSGIDLRKYGPGSSITTHIIIELLKHAFADRARFLGDERPASLAGVMLAPERLKRLAKKISLPKVKPLSSYGDKTIGTKKNVVEDGGTSHLCVVDKAGNAVALTSTVNLFFGSGLVTDKSGIVLNDEIDDFAIEVDQPNAFGLVQSEYNIVGPGKRPLSSMTPTLVLDGDKVVACAGGSGGPRIISNTIQALLNVLVFGMNARQAVSASRVHHQWYPDKVLIEPDMVGDVRDALRKKGHSLEEISYSTAVQMVVVDQAGLKEAASDPRKGGAPAAESMR